ncbi:MAG: hypothetical protein HYZ57_13195 [Acidobacteria bacterium]|nr:hypothetical protein [Acidobacteriota bacterium]
MATIQQIEANRRNAQKSTEPRSDPGKQHSRDNAFKHGMCSQRVVLPFEDPHEYHLLHARIVSEQQPRSMIEMLLLDRIAAAFWRLERAIGVESALMSSSVRNLKIRCKVDDQPGGQHEGIDYYEGLSICMSKDPRAFEIQMRYQTTVRRELTQMLGQLERIRRHPLPAASEPLNLPPVEPGDVIEIPTAASAPRAQASSVPPLPDPGPTISLGSTQPPGSAGLPSQPLASQADDSPVDTGEIGFVSQSPLAPARGVTSSPAIPPDPLHSL